MIVVAFFRDSAIFQYNDTFRHANGREAMRDEQGHFRLGQFVEALKDFVFSASVESGGRLVENKDLGIAEVSASESQLLPFATGQVDTALKTAAEHLFVPFCEARDDAVGKTLFGCATDAFAIV